MLSRDGVHVFTRLFSKISEGKRGCLRSEWRSVLIANVVYRETNARKLNSLTGREDEG